VCFSASASYTAGVVIGGVGVATLSMVHDRKQRMFAALPLLFGVHQLLEGVIWTQLDESGRASLRTPAVQLWLLIAWLVLPIWVPLAVRMFEPDERRRRWMLGLAFVGAAIGVFLAVQSVLSSSGVQAYQNHLEYGIPVAPSWLLAMPYVLATCIPLLISSQPFVRVFGVAMVVSMGVTAGLAAKSFSSVWCYLAAVLSAMLFVHFLLLNRREQAGDPNPGTAGAPR